ncbi:MAG TPA: anti-sigma factor [Gemmatimonadales bacterium]
MAASTTSGPKVIYTRARPERRWPLVVAAALAVSAGILGWWGWRESRELASTRGSLNDAIAAYRDTLSLLRSPSTRVITIPVSTNGQVGAVTIFADTLTHRWLVTAHHLAANRPGQVYQLWLITTTGMVNASVLPVSGSAPTVEVLEMPKGEVVTGVQMTIEPGKGSPAPTGPMVFHYLL